MILVRQFWLSKSLKSHTKEGWSYIVKEVNNSTTRGVYPYAIVLCQAEVGSVM